jgi:hypothetical protein
MATVAVDSFLNYSGGLDSPATHAAVITGDDSNDLVSVTRAICVGTAGNIKITTLGGETIVMAFPAGTTAIRVTRIWLAGLSAVGVTALW